MVVFVEVIYCSFQMFKHLFDQILIIKLQKHDIFCTVFHRVHRSVSCELHHVDSSHWSSDPNDCNHCFCPQRQRWDDLDPDRALINNLTFESNCCALCLFRMQKATWRHKSELKTTQKIWNLYHVFLFQSKLWTPNDIFVSIWALYYLCQS